jgi:signal transduction histidine kinase
MTALLLVLEGLVLIVLGADLARDFEFLPGAARGALLAAAVAGVLPLLHATTRARVAPAARRPLAMLAAAGAVLALLALAADTGARRIAASWPMGAGARLESRARVLQDDFGAFLVDLGGPLQDLPATVPDRRAAFDALAAARRRARLPAERHGLAAHRADGTLLAWEGNSTAPPRRLLEDRDPGLAFAAGGRPASPRLFAVLTRAPDGDRFVSEYVLRLPGPPDTGDAGAGVALDFLPRWDRVAPAHVHFRTGRDGDDDLGTFFARQGDRHWSHLGDGGTASVSFPLRSSAGTVLAIVNLTDGGAGEAIAALRRGLRRAAALALAALLLAVWVPAAGRGGPLRRFLLGAGAVVSVRGALLLLGDAASLPRLPVFDITLYASSAYGGLARSPADLFLTAAALLAAAMLARTALRDHPLPSGPDARRRAFPPTAAAALVVLAGGAALLHRFLDGVVLDARIDLSRLAGSSAGPRLLIQLALFALTAAWAVTAVALLARAARLLPDRWRQRIETLRRLAGPRPWPAPVRLAAATVLLTLLYVPALHHAYDRLRQDFFENDLLDRVVHQTERRRQILRDSLRHAGEPEFAVGALFARDPDEGGWRSDEVAYRLWAGTPMAQRGLASSLQIFDSGGARLGRFAFNFAPMLDVPFERAAAAAGGGPIEVPPDARATVKKAVLFGARWVRAARKPPLLVVLSLIDAWDNLPMLGGPTVTFDLFRAPSPARTNPELLRSEPLVAVFGDGLERLYESGGEIPPPAPAHLERVKGGGRVWTFDTTGEGLGHILYARGDGVIVALAHPHAGPLGLVASFLRLLLLNTAAAGAAALGAAALRAAAARAPLHLPPLTYAGRLVAVLVVSGLVPLLALAYFVTRFNAADSERDLLTSGLGSLQAARRVVEDYLDVSAPDPGPVLDDDVAFWLSRVVRQDINVYRDGELLATSTRELYGSGLLDTRLPGAAYRAIVLGREPFLLDRARVAGTDYLTLSAPTRVERDGPPGVIAIPLAAQRRAVERRAGEVDDALLITTCFAALLLAAVGWLMARRVAEPVSHLARAARRVAAGDLEVRVGARASDETAVLVDAFNRMAAALREQRETLKRRKDYIETILRSVTTGVVAIDAAGTITTINPSAQGLLRDDGGAPEIGDSLPARLEALSSLAPLRDALARALERPEEDEAEVVLDGPHGGRRLRVVFIPFAVGGTTPRGRIVILEDVTEVVRSGRLAAWTEMARRVAHEIKNPLTPIQLSVEHARRVRRAGHPQADAVLEQCLDNIQKQVGVLRQIAHEFSAYARLPEVRPVPTAVRDLVHDALAPYAAAAPPGLRVEASLPEDLPPVLADRTTVVRALVNLIENALQAMPAGGSLRVAAAADNGAPPGRVRIEVRDTGPGIDPAVLPRLFEPYFSTKSGGTGLGLPVSRRAVEEQGGSLDIASRPGEGTVAILTLPVAPPAGGGGA